MIAKIKLYLDTLNRIPLKQSISLFKAKVLKKIIPIKISSLSEIESAFNLDKQIENFRRNLEKLKHKNSDQYLWDLGIAGKNFQHHYHSYIHNQLKQYLLSENLDELEKLWAKTHDDIEFRYNIQRMYKFKEIMEILEFTDTQKLNVIKSWIEKFPPKKNVSWTGFNCSIRLLNWVKILTNLKSFNNVSREEIKIIILSINQNLEFIEKNIEHHIPGNHVVFQYFALWLVTFLLDDGRKNRYATLFENEFNREFLDSGLHFELSTHYHLQVLLLGVYYSLMNYEQNQIPKLFFNKIKKAFYVLDLFSFEKNSLPLIGDNCYNFFHNNLVEDVENLNYLRKLLGIEKEEENNLIEIKNEYLIANQNRFKVIFDVGNIGMPQNPGHGHSDILSINLAFNGIPIFVDPGTKRYSNLSENLELKRTQSHNTISVNGEDQAKLWGFFRWAFLPEKHVYHYNREENSVTLEGKFNGFKNIGGAIHSRKIVLNDFNVSLYDKVTCRILNKVEQNFILSELVTFEENNRKYYLTIDDYKFEFIIKCNELHQLEILPQKIYKSYDNPVNSNKIKIIYNTSLRELETKIELVLVNE